MSTTYLDQLIELTPEAAEKIVSLRADDDLQNRVDALAQKANNGLLNEEERAEYERFLAAFHFVTILQARARHILVSKQT